MTEEDAVTASVECNVGELQTQIVEQVRALLEPLFMVFEFFELADLARERARRQPAGWVAVTRAVTTRPLLDESHLDHLHGSALGALWERNIGFLRSTWDFRGHSVIDEKCPSTRNYDAPRVRQATLSRGRWAKTSRAT